MIRALAFLSLAAIALAASARAQEPAEPDPRLTPGAIASHDVTEICARDERGHLTYSPAHRVWRHKPSTLMNTAFRHRNGAFTRMTTAFRFALAATIRIRAIIGPRSGARPD